MGYLSLLQFLKNHTSEWHLESDHLSTLFTEFVVYTLINLFRANIHVLEPVLIHE